MRGVKKQDVFQAEQAWVSAQELQVPCLHAQELLRARCSCGRDPPRYSSSKYLVLKNLCPLNGHLSHCWNNGMLLGPLKGCLTRDAKLAACSDFKAAFGIEEQFSLQVQGGKEEVCWR